MDKYVLKSHMGNLRYSRILSRALENLLYLKYLALIYNTTTERLTDEFKIKLKWIELILSRASKLNTKEPQSRQIEDKINEKIYSLFIMLLVCACCFM